MNPIITAHQEIVIENSVRYIELLKSEASKILDEYWEASEGTKPTDIPDHVCKRGRFIHRSFCSCAEKGWIVAKTDNCMERFFARGSKTKLNIMAWLLNLNSEDTALVVLKMLWTGNWR